MRTKTCLLLLLFSSLAPARDRAENWIEVTSPHFVVATNSNEKQARRVADQFERMRSVFHKLFPKLEIDPGAPIIVLAIRDEKDFRALEPEAYLAKGQLKLGGLFLPGLDKNYILMRLDAEGDHPYSTVYHEYTHLLLSKDAELLPLWVNEGLAELYQTVEIKEKDVSLGKPIVENVYFLRGHNLLPLATLFAVDHNSPYYHEEDKGSIFYAESWALVHYLVWKDHRENKHRLKDYLDLIASQKDSVAAASIAFGDLNELTKALSLYIRQSLFPYITNTTSTEIDESNIRSQPLSPPQADALRADFLAYNQRTNDARSLLEQVLKEDPNNVSAHETMGFLEFHQGHIDAAKKWYAEAIQLDSRSYLAYYYFSAISMQGAMTPAEEKQCEASLRRGIELNPSFAPTYDRLAIFLDMRHRNLDEAHTMSLQAVSLEPTNVGYRVNVANILLTMERPQNAIQVLEAARKLAKSPEEKQWVENDMRQAEQMEQTQQRIADEEHRMDAPPKDSEELAANSDAPIPKLVHREFVARGPHHFIIGTLRNVHCDSSNLDLAVKSGAKTLDLHTDNYYRIQFSVLGFQPGGDLKPCEDLEGRPAKVEYVESADKSEAPHLVGIELHK